MRSKKQIKRLKSISIISTLIVLIICFGYVLYKKYNPHTDSFDKNSKYLVRGIDVSHHNPILDWKEVKDQGIHFAYIKATEGITHDDRNYKYNYDLARENKVKVGSYHFYNFGVSGYEQAKHFIRVAKCNSGDLFPAIDVEHSPANPYNTDSAFFNSIIKELQILENELFQYYGFHPIIYTNNECYKLYIKDQFPDNFIWISSIPDEPKEDIKNWIIWQFSHKGKLPGIVGDIDFNYFRLGFEKLVEISFP